MTVYAAKVLAAAAAELMVNPELLQRAKEDHARRVGPDGYVPPIPQGAKPIALDSLRK
jgi:aminobenzoyl-glutamate utilization protein B